MPLHPLDRRDSDKASALSLDAVLAHSRIVDLRIAGPNGQQIPYLFEKMDEPLSLNLTALEKPKLRVRANSIPPGERLREATTGCAFPSQICLRPVRYLPLQAGFPGVTCAS
jgi:hypothetical protein